MISGSGSNMIGPPLLQKLTTDKPLESAFHVSCFHKWQYETRRKHQKEDMKMKKNERQEREAINVFWYKTNKRM